MAEGAEQRLTGLLAEGGPARGAFLCVFWGDSLAVEGRPNPFRSYKVVFGMTVSDLLRKAGGTTRNADVWNIRRDTSWQDDLTALTPLALILNIFASTGHL